MKSLLMIVASVVIFGTQCVATAQTSAQSQQSTANGYAPPYPEAEADLRKIRFGEREINLAEKLRNGELKVENDDLEGQLAQLKEEPKSSPRTAIDHFIIEQETVAIDISRRFEIAWSYRGTKDMQHEMFDLEKNFDIAVQSCLPDKGTVDESEDEIKANCAKLHEIDIATTKYQFRGVATPSVFKENIIGRPTLAQRLLREDDLQTKADMAAYQPGQLRTQLHSGGQSIRELQQAQLSAVQVLLSLDQEIIDWDKQIRLAELSAVRTVKHNNAHPESPEADGSGVTALFVSMHQELAERSRQYRRDLAIGISQARRDIAKFRK